jgi:multidrug efflux pump subunit AcrA (membrane-fusion protein)
LAPGDGPVVEVRVEEGSAVRPGTAVARVATAPSVVRIRVPERHLAYLRAADAIRIATADGPVTGKLRRLYPDVVGGRVQADLALPAGVEPEPVGRRLAVTLQVAEREALLVPRALVEARAGLAFVRREDGGRTLVQLGRRVGERVVVLSGLEAGDRLTPP